MDGGQVSRRVPAIPQRGRAADTRSAGRAGASTAGGRRWATLAVLCVTLLLISLDNTILNVAIPSIVRSLQATSSELQWMVGAYAIFFAGLPLTLGAMGVWVGRNWFFRGARAVFPTASA